MFLSSFLSGLSFSRLLRVGLVSCSSFDNVLLLSLGSSGSLLYSLRRPSLSRLRSLSRLSSVLLACLSLSFFVGVFNFAQPSFPSSPEITGGGGVGGRPALGCVSVRKSTSSLPNKLQRQNEISRRGNRLELSRDLVSRFCVYLRVELLSLHFLRGNCLRVISTCPLVGVNRR